MSKIESAISWMQRMANDNSHGYDQIYRWGQRGDYDCSSAVISAWEQAGVKVKSAGATYTGNMRPVFLRCGFTDITNRVNLATGAGLQRGDVLLNTIHHTAMYCGNGREVQASINEKGTATGGKPGDQTGREFLIRSYRNYPWNCVLRYTAESSALAAPTSNNNKKSVEQIAAEVLAGKWGNGNDRKNRLTAAGYDYAAVQAVINKKVAPASNSRPADAPAPSSKLDGARSFNRAIAGTYVVTADRLNVRSGASTSKTILGAINGGTTIQCFGYYTNGWYLIKVGNLTGYCAKEYLRRK